MGIIFRRLKNEKGRDKYGTLDPETGEPVVHEDLKSDQFAVDLVVAHEERHRQELEGDAGFAPFDSEPLAHLAAFKELGRKGGMPRKKMFESRMARELCGAMLERQRLYFANGGDSTYDSTNGNLHAMFEAQRELDARFREIEQSRSNLERGR